MARDTGLGIGLAMAVPILLGLVTDFIAIGVAAGIIAGTIVARQWPPRLRDLDVAQRSDSLGTADHVDSA